MDTKVCARPDCLHQGAPQPIDQFCADKTRKDGRHPYCRSCRAELARQRLTNSADARKSARDASARYNQTEHGKQHAHQYYLDHKAEYRARERAYSKLPANRERQALKAAAYRAHNRDKVLARHAARRALVLGELTKPDRCEWCGQPAESRELACHHWRGYSPIHWLDVRFVHTNTCHLACECVRPELWPVW